MGVIAMKVFAAGQLLHGNGRLTADEALGYVWSLPGVSTAIIGCQTPDEVDANAANARRFVPLDDAPLRALEARTHAQAGVCTYYKKRRSA